MGFDFPAFLRPGKGVFMDKYATIMMTQRKRKRSKREVKVVLPATDLCAPRKTVFKVKKSY
jgi:hypothetical protein